MRFSILIPHYKTGKMTAYCISQLLKFKGRHEIKIIIIDNSNGEGIEYFQKYIGPHPTYQIQCITYPSDKLQSHGIAFDYAIEYYEKEHFVQERIWDNMQGDYFITMESDSFPTQDNWLDYYENLINEGYDMSGSCLKLSGGQYIHPAGAMYRKSLWKEAREFVKHLNSTYNYYPNLGMKGLFPCHIMSNEILTDFPLKHHSYNNVNFEEQLRNYLPIAQSVFHNGMGCQQEDFNTYGQRNIASGTLDIGNDFTDKTIYRMGYEPGQWFSYWHYATGRKVKQIDTEIEWMPERRNQQQEYTLMSNGFKHLWGVTAYSGSNDESTKDISNRKNQLMEELYQSIK